MLTHEKVFARVRTEVHLERRYTVDEFLELDFEDDWAYELIDGKIILPEFDDASLLSTEQLGFGDVSAKHGRIMGAIGGYLQTTFGQGSSRVGTLYIKSGYGFADKDYFLVADISFVLQGCTPVNFSGPIPVVPDLVVEVISPTDTLGGIDTKIKAHQAVGVPLIWSVSSTDETIRIYKLGEPYFRFLQLDDEIDGGNVLPNLKVSIRKFFE